MNVAKNIIRREKGKEMVRFHYEQHGSILSLGRKCIGIMNGVIIKGSFMWICRRLPYRQLYSYNQK